MTIPSRSSAPPFQSRAVQTSPTWTSARTARSAQAGSNPATPAAAARSIGACTSANRRTTTIGSGADAPWAGVGRLEEDGPLAGRDSASCQRDQEAGRDSRDEHERECPQGLRANALRDEELTPGRIEDQAESRQQGEAHGRDQRDVAEASPEDGGRESPAAAPSRRTASPARGPAPGVGRTALRSPRRSCS